MRNLMRLLFGFEGRIGRLQFWMACIALCTLLILLGLVQALAELALAPRTFDPAATIVVWLTVIPTIAIGVKRFNDLGWSTWIVYALNLAGVGIWIGLSIGVPPDGSAYRALLMFGNLAAGTALFILCAFIKGRSVPAPMFAATAG